MPICLNCGKSIPRGSKYCDACTSLSKSNPVLKTPDLQLSSPRRDFKRRDHRVIIITALVLFIFLVVLAYGLMSMFPEDRINNIQAKRCRERMTTVGNAVTKYKLKYENLPPSGTLNNVHPLVQKGYLKSGLKCPSTGRYYQLEVTAGDNIHVLCDSKLKGHEIKQEY